MKASEELALLRKRIAVLEQDVADRTNEAAIASRRLNVIGQGIYDKLSLKAGDVLLMKGEGIEVEEAEALRKALVKATGVSVPILVLNEDVSINKLSEQEAVKLLFGKSLPPPAMSEKWVGPG